MPGKISEVALENLSLFTVTALGVIKLLPLLAEGLDYSWINICHGSAAKYDMASGGRPEMRRAQIAIPFLNTSAEFLDPKAMQLHSACSMVCMRPD